MLKLSLGVLLFSSLAFAQMSYEAVPMRQSSSGGNGQSGFFFGLNYMTMNNNSLKWNYTDSQGASQTLNSNNTTSYASEGIRLGYQYSPSQGFGFSFAALAQKILGNSTDPEIGFAGGEANLIYSFIPQLAMYLGINATQIYEQPEVANPYYPYYGGQAGLTLKLGQHFSLSAGYELFQWQAKIYTANENFTTSSVGTLSRSGITSNIGFVF